MDDPARDAFGAAWERALTPWIRGDLPATLLFSGGLDSSLVASELVDLPGVEGVTVGRPGCIDLLQAESAAELLGFRSRRMTVGDGLLERLVVRFADELSRTPPPLRPVLLGLAAGLSASPTSSVICGQGADELFLGYAHFRSLSADDAAARAERDLRLLLEEEWPRTQRVARQLGHEIHTPFLDPGVVRVASSIPIVQRLPHPVPKQWLREWAVSRGLPAEIAFRPKKALQYGSGLGRWFSRRGSGAPPVS